jgi:acetamidase/formamidase
VLHEIPLGRETIHGHFSAALPPVLTVDPGDSVQFQSLDAWWRWAGPDEEFFDSIDPELATR